MRHAATVLIFQSIVIAATVFKCAWAGIDNGVTVTGTTTAPGWFRPEGIGETEKDVNTSWSQNRSRYFPSDHTMPCLAPLRLRQGEQVLWRIVWCFQQWSEWHLLRGPVLPLRCSSVSHQPQSTVQKQQAHWYLCYAVKINMGKSHFTCDLHVKTGDFDNLISKQFFGIFLSCNTLINMIELPTTTNFQL